MGNFDYLDGHRCINLTTFRRSGDSVPTVVWFANVNGTLYVVTRETTGKVKRLRHTARVTLAPCDDDGNEHGATIPAEARIVGGNESAIAAAALDAKYGGELRRLLRIDPHIRRVHLAISESDDA